MSTRSPFRHIEQRLRDGGGGGGGGGGATWIAAARRIRAGRADSCGVLARPAGPARTRRRRAGGLIRCDYIRSLIAISWAGGRVTG